MYSIYMYSRDGSLLDKIFSCSCKKITEDVMWNLDYDKRNNRAIAKRLYNIGAVYNPNLNYALVNFECEKDG